MVKIRNEGVIVVKVKLSLWRIKSNMYIRLKHYLIGEIGGRAGRAGFGDCPKTPTFLEKGQALNERKVLLELLKFSQAIEEAIKPNEIYIWLQDFLEHQIDEIIRVESQKVSGYTYELSEEKSLERIEKQLRYNEGENLFEKIREKGKLFIGQLKNLKCVELIISSEQNQKGFEQN